MLSSRSIAVRFAKAAAITVCVSAPAKASTKDQADNAVPVTCCLPQRAAEVTGSIVKIATLQSSQMPLSGPAVNATVRAAMSDSPSESVKPIFRRQIPNLPDRELIAVLVNYPPAARSRSHHHASSAFIYAYVLSGEIRSAIGGEPARIYRAGESFYEEPGAHHVVSENASDSEPASLLAVFVVRAGDQPLTAPDAESGK
jgi:quercetin dioxygenase-like cupin family protein